VECDVDTMCLSKCVYGFNPHTPRGVWLKGNEIKEKEISFNPHTPRGVWPIERALTQPLRMFQSTHSSWSVTHPGILQPYHSRFQSTHSSWSVTAITNLYVHTARFQSTHSSWSVTGSRLLFKPPV